MATLAKERTKFAWRTFKARRPGTRFWQSYYQHSINKRNAVSRAGHIALGVAVIVIGLVALPLPGPGMLVIALGLALMARESSRLAHGLDRLEVWGRAELRRLKRRKQWKSVLGEGTR